MLRLLLVLALTPLCVGAQSNASGGVFVARNASLPDPPFAIGFEIRAALDRIALRLSGGGLATGTPANEYGPDTTSYHGAIDLDLQFDPARAGAASLLPFAGVGFVGAAPYRGRSQMVPMFSYGLALRIPIDRRLVVQLETRERLPIRDASAVTSLGIGRGWEQRIGLSVPFPGARLGEFPPGAGIRRRLTPPADSTRRVPDADRASSAPP